VILGLSVCLLGYHCSLCTAAFYNYGFAPYPQLDPRLGSFLRPSAERSEKILPLGSNRSQAPDFPNSMKNQWPTQYQIFSLWGADGMVMDAPDVRRMVQRVSDDFARFLPEYGVRYVVKYTRPDDFSPEPPLAFDIVYRSDNVTLYEVPDPRPIAYSEAAPNLALPVQFDARGAEIATSALSHGGPLILNMLWRREMVAKANSGAALAVGSDALERIRIEVPPGCDTLRIDFLPPWRFGILVAVGLLVLAAGAGCLSQRQ
jgi:hypothetical protein